MKTFGIFAAGKHGREAFSQRDGVRFGKHFGVTPHGGGAVRKLLAGESFLDRRQIVAGVEDSAVFRADGLRCVRA